MNKKFLNVLFMRINKLVLKIRFAYVNIICEAARFEIYWYCN